jgi:hypothetical protein
VNRHVSLTEEQLSQAIAQKTAEMDKEGATAALRGIPAHRVEAKRIERELDELKAELGKRSAR